MFMFGAGIFFRVKLLAMGSTPGLLNIDIDLVKKSFRRVQISLSATVCRYR